MRILVLLFLAFAVDASLQCTCPTLKWATCDGSPCVCTVQVDNSVKQLLNCTALIPKCYLMKAEMFRLRSGMSTRSGGKPTEHALVDNDGMYDPDCHPNGAFHSKQCNNTEECWCVNSAGVRRSDVGDKFITCELVETYWVRLDLTHKPVTSPLDSTKIRTGIGNMLQQRFNLNTDLIKNVQYDEKARLIVVDIKKDMGDRTLDLSRFAYYLAKDVNAQPLFFNATKLMGNIAGQSVDFQKVIIYYVDEKPPTFTMKRLTGGVIAVIVVVTLVVVGSLLILYFVRKREYKMAQAH